MNAKQVVCLRCLFCLQERSVDGFFPLLCAMQTGVQLDLTVLVLPALYRTSLLISKIQEVNSNHVKEDIKDI